MGTGRRIDYLWINEIGVPGFAACRRTVIGKNDPGIVRVIITGVRV